MTQDSTPPAWRRPPGVSKGTWQYVHQRTIARHYQSFVADTPLCKLDERYVLEHLQRQQNDSARQKSTAQNAAALNGLVVDFGCGNGRLALPISRQGWDVLAIDLSRPMLEEVVGNTAGDHVSEPGASQLPCGAVMPMRANLVELQAVRDAIADHAVCMFSTLGMIQGRRSRRSFLRHAARIVRPGGTLVLHVHRRWAALRERGGWRKLLGNRLRSWYRREVEFGDAVYAYRGLENMFMHRFTAGEIRGDLRDAGWRTERLERVDLRGEQLTASTWDAGGLFVVARREAATWGD